jgi:hypothetical protein
MSVRHLVRRRSSVSDRGQGRRRRPVAMATFVTGHEVREPGSERHHPNPGALVLVSDDGSG